MGERKYSINPNFVVPEPTAANFFAYLSHDEFSHEEATRIFDGWKVKGCKQARLTTVNDEYPHPPYPDGYWLEGWTDERARQLAFGEAQTPDGPIYPPLVHENGNLASRGASS